MQCYNYEALCRTLVMAVRERYPELAFDRHDAADAIDAYAVEDVTQFADIISIARNIGCGIRLAA